MQAEPYRVVGMTEQPVAIPSGRYIDDAAAVDGRVQFSATVTLGRVCLRGQ